MKDPLELVSQARLIDLLKTLVSIPSVTGDEQRLADWMADHFETIGLQDVARLPVEEAGDVVFGWINGRAGGPTMMLNFHMDTFDAFDGWHTDPFSAHLEEGRLYGLGTHDMKGGAACVLAAVEALIESGVPLNGRLLVTATTDEENWSRGAHTLIQSGILDGCQYCLVPEPSRRAELTIGQRGRHVFHLAFHGKTVHAAYEGGINAVADAATVVGLLSNPSGIDLGYDDRFDRSGTLRVIGLHGGGTLILIPERADLYIDRHILPGETVETAAAQIQQIIDQAEIASTVKLRWDERPTPAPPPFLVPSDSFFVQTVQNHIASELESEVRFVLGRSVADTNHFAAHGNVPTLIYGPQGGNTCEANEYVEVDSLPSTARIYIRSVLDLLSSQA
jgi:acetylornithine deacetylase/succinyl-diaminopimelate desuccinylase-like protein